MALQKNFKGDKYIYLLMGYILAKQTEDKSIAIGVDNGMIGGQNYYRRFTIQNYQDKILLMEHKTSKSFADFSKTYEVTEYPISKNVGIKEYWNESNENCSANWVH